MYMDTEDEKDQSSEEVPGPGASFHTLEDGMPPLLIIWRLRDGPKTEEELALFLEGSWDEGQSLTSLLVALVKEEVLELLDRSPRCYALTEDGKAIVEEMQRSVGPAFMEMVGARVTDPRAPPARAPSEDE